MKASLKDKVIARLIKGGNNPVEVQDMVHLHFAQAVCLYSSVKNISEFIRTVY